MSDAACRMSLDGVLDELSRSYPDRTATVFKDNRTTHAQLRVRVDRLANALERAGVAMGDRILWLGRNAPGILEGILAAARLGAMFCPANWRQSAAEIAFVIDDLEPKIVFWEEDEVGGLIRTARDLASHRSAVWLQYDSAGQDSYEALLESGSPDAKNRDIDPGLPLLILYTAAFEGRPNGAMLSQTAILFQNLILQRVQNLSASSVYLNSGPLFHVGTLMVTLATFHAGGANIFLPRTTVEDICATIEKERCTGAFLIGKIAQDIVAFNRDGRYDLKSLQSPSLFPEFDAMVAVTASKDEIRNYGYGQTELMGFASWTFFEAGRTIGAYGRTSPLCQIRIVDDCDTDVPAGETGEILVRGPNVINGYFRRPELTARRRRGGWHHTNDLGRRESDGSITFIGPKTQMIKSGVENVYPAEIEACLRSHPAVADCAAIGVPDAVFVQTVKAIVQLRPGMAADEADLVEHCRTRIASYKKPRSVAFVETIARTQAGAIDYAALDAAHGGGGYPGGETRSS